MTEVFTCPTCGKPMKRKCKSCYDVKWREENKGRKREYDVKWREENREYFKKWRDENGKSTKEYNEKWRKENKDKTKEYAKRWREESPQKYKEYIKRWQKENPEKLKSARNRYRTSKTLAGGSFTAEEWIALCNKYDNKCLCCGEKKKLTADHVIPVSKGGTSNIDNIQPLCKSCNSSKSTKEVDYRIGV